VLSANAIAVMELIAQGHSYEQILRACPTLTYPDIFDAAREVLRKATEWEASRFAEIRRRHPRAYEKWTPDEERQLQTLVLAGCTVAQIAGTLQRQRGAIRSRIMPLGLVEKLSTKEQERLNRIVARERRSKSPEPDLSAGNDD
jgi:DNA-binding NarL/FixJ family response regulator